MDFSEASAWLFIPLQILFVDLLLGADNALVIALVCRSLPPRDVNQAATIGVAGAIVLRLTMAVVATSLLTIPLVKIVAGGALVWIAMNLTTGEQFDAADEEGPRGAANLWSAAAIIVIADAAMSLDNVVALAAIARGNFGWLAIGVALSLPVLGYGGVMLAGLLKRAPGLTEFGAALLGWIAGGMLITDSILSGWADVNAPGLVALAPALGAAYIFVYGRWVGRPARAEARNEPRRQAPRVAPPPVAPVSAKPTPPAAEPPPREAMPETPTPPLSFETPADAAEEPEDQHEPDPAPPSRDDRMAIIGILLLAVFAGAVLMIVSYLDSIN